MTKVNRFFLEIKKKQETNQVPVVPSKTQVYLEKKKDIDRIIY